METSLTNLGFARPFPDRSLLKIRISLRKVDLPKEFIMFAMLNIGKTLGNLGFANSFIIDRESKIGKTLGNLDSIKEFIMNGPVYPGPGHRLGGLKVSQSPKLALKTAMIPVNIPGKTIEHFSQSYASRRASPTNFVNS